MSVYPSYTVLPASGELGRSGSMRLSGYQHLICSAAESDMISRRCSVKETIEKGYAWAFTSITVDVLAPLTGCEPLTAVTWLSSDRFPINRRELQFFRGEAEMFRAAVFSTPVSVTTHAITRPEDYLSDCVAGEPVVENAVSRITGIPETREVFRRKVYPSDIDALGHMNNCRYGALAYDALTDDERLRLSLPYRFTINFRRQLFEGSTVVVSRGQDERGIFIVGTAEGSDKHSFVVLLEI